MRGIFDAGNFESMPNMADQQAASRAESTSRNAQREVRHLRASLNKAMLICETLWELLRDSTKLTEQDLYKKMYEVDMRDGVLDGKNQRKAVECGQCGRTVSSRHPACLYCGTIIDNSVFTL